MNEEIPIGAADAVHEALTVLRRNRLGARHPLAVQRQPLAEALPGIGPDQPTPEHSTLSRTRQLIDLKNARKSLIAYTN